MLDNRCPAPGSKQVETNGVPKKVKKPPHQSSNSQMAQNCPEMVNESPKANEDTPRCEVHLHTHIHTQKQPTGYAKLCRTPKDLRSPRASGCGSGTAGCLAVAVCHTLEGAADKKNVYTPESPLFRGFPGLFQGQLKSIRRQSEAKTN